MSTYEKSSFGAEPAADGAKTITVNGRIFRCPFADVMPSLTPEERAALRDDIERRGIVVPVQVDEQDGVLDGQHRLQIAAELKLTDIPVKVVPGLSDAQKRALAEDLNLHRRHLTRQQVRQVLARRLKENPAQSDHALATAVGVDHKTVGAARQKLERSGEIPQMDTRTDRKGHQRRGRRRSRANAKRNKAQSDLSPPAPPLQETVGSESAGQALPAESSMTTTSTPPVAVQTATPEPPLAPTVAGPTEATPAPVPTATNEPEPAPSGTSHTAAAPMTKLGSLKSRDLLFYLLDHHGRPITDEIKRLLGVKAEDRDLGPLLELFESGARLCRRYHA